MTAVHFNRNRPVHIARRDVFYERAVELLYMPPQGADTVLRLQHMDHVRSLLRTAELHAYFALLSQKTDPAGENFLQFLKLVTDNVKSIHAMLTHQLQLETGGGFLGEFLSASPQDTVLPALHYQRRAEDILQGLWHVLRLAQEPYRELHEHDVDSLDEGERARFERATNSFRDEVLSRFAVAMEGSPTPPADAEN